MGNGMSLCPLRLDSNVAQTDFRGKHVLDFHENGYTWTREAYLLDLQGVPCRLTQAFYCPKILEQSPSPPFFLITKTEETHGEVEISMWAGRLIVPHEADGHPRDLAESNGFENVNIMLELLWGGITSMTNDSIRFQDEEVASLRPAKRLLQIFQHEIPKQPAGIEEHLDHLSQSDISITAEEFEQLVFTAVYCAYQIRAIQGLEKNLWINLFSQLITEIIRELCKQVCPVESMDSVQLLASRPWQEIPFYITALKNSYQSKLIMN
ncbi:protein FAM180B [Sphaerodactylus townsendi]|uniref:protein FAM180B n=1 Tax=Sphaerodactylus townsendi TaxID=933632 RepID=UPI002026FDB4|nr:protein FAM180B [Sphaerodactylus townsendi]